jgi:hypothetical protein
MFYFLGFFNKNWLEFNDKFEQIFLIKLFFNV